MTSDLNDLRLDVLRVSVSSNEKRAIANAAKLQNISMSELIRQLVRRAEKFPAPDHFERAARDRARQLPAATIHNVTKGTIIK